MQQQIEFETIPFQHTVRIPDIVPVGVSVRIVLSFDDAKANQNTQNRDVINDRKPEYLTMTVNEIDMPTRDERYER